MIWPDTAFFVTAAHDALNRPTVLKEKDITNLARRRTVTLGNGTTAAHGYQGDMNSVAHNLTGTAHDQTYG